MEKYISVNMKTDETQTRVKMLNPDNLFVGTIKTIDASSDDKETTKDVNDIFVHLNSLKDIQPIDIAKEEYSLDDIVQRFNALIIALKTIH